MSATLSSVKGNVEEQKSKELGYTYVQEDHHCCALVIVENGTITAWRGSYLPEREGGVDVGAIECGEACGIGACSAR